MSQLAPSQVVALDHLQLAMPAGREAEARAFYGDILGLPELTKPANLAVRGGVWFALGTQQLHLGVEGDFRPAKKAHPAFLVRGLAGLRAPRAGGLCAARGRAAVGLSSLLCPRPLRQPA